MEGIRKFIVKEVPLPNVLSASIVPLWASTIAFANGRPRPIPCVSLEKPASIKPFENMVQIFGMNAASIVLYGNLDNGSKRLPFDTDKTAFFSSGQGHFD